MANVVLPGFVKYQRHALLNLGLDQFYVRTKVAGATYTVRPNDRIIAVTSATGSTITLPSIRNNLKLHQTMIVVIDEAGTAEANPVTITPAGSEQIDNVAGAFTINSNNGAVILYAENDTPGWHILARSPSAAISGVYNPARPTDWETAPVTLASALDKLAYGYFIAHGVVPDIPP